MSAIFGLTGPHTPQDAEKMGSRLKHRGGTSHIESGDGISAGIVGGDPGLLLYRRRDALVVAAGTVYGTSDGSAIKESPGNLAEFLCRRVSGADPGGLSVIDGDFAAVAWDGKAGRILLMRDFFGCIPLYWCALQNGGIAFASEYKALLALDYCKPVVDRHMVQYLQGAKRIPVGRTLFKNIHAAEPGLTVIEKQEMAARSAFPPLTCNVRLRDEETACEVIGGQFREASRRRIAGHEPIGIALSGGIDSIALAFQVRELLPDAEIHTFTAGYGEDDPEWQTAGEVASRIGASHHPVRTPPDLILGSFRKLVWHLEDPVSRSETLQLMRIGEVASGVVDRLLSGQGADGLFAGMPRHRLLRMTGPLSPMRAPLLEIFDLTQLGVQPASLAGRALATALYRGKVPPVPVVIDGGVIPRAARVAPGPQFLNRMLAAGYRDSALQDVAKFERTFGASGVSYASPFLDATFARTAFEVDENLKIRKGKEKYIFRRAVASIVPQKFRALPKHPQGMEYDLAFAACLDVLSDELLSPSSVRSRGLFEPGSIDRLRRRRHDRPYAPEAAMRLWTALATEVWARLFLDDDTQTGPSHAAVKQQS